MRQANAHEQEESILSSARHTKKDCGSLAEELSRLVVVAQIRLTGMSLVDFQANVNGVSDSLISDIAGGLDVEEEHVMVLGCEQGSLIVKFSVMGDEEALKTQ